MEATLDESVGADHEYAIQKACSLVLKDLIGEGKYQGLWGVPTQKGLTYELYYTERTIEALTELFLHYQRVTTDVLKPVLRRPEHRKVTGKASSSERTAGGEDVRLIAGREPPPNDLDKYTMWIPSLAQGARPRALEQHQDWPIEDLLEFYLYRLFNNVFLLDGREWGYRRRGENLPDGRICLPDKNAQFLYDAKSSKKAYAISRDELRKFFEYVEEGKKHAAVARMEVGFFVIVSNGFGGDLKDRAQDVLAKTGISLVCRTASGLCRFADKARGKTTNSRALIGIPWSRLLARGSPVLSDDDFDATLTEWEKDISDSLDL